MYLAGHEKKSVFYSKISRNPTQGILVREVGRSGLNFERTLSAVQGVKCTGRLWDEISEADPTRPEGTWIKETAGKRGRR